MNNNKIPDTNINKDLDLFTLQHICKTLVPNLPYSSFKLYLFYLVQSSKSNYKHILDLECFSQVTNTSPKTAYIALTNLKSLNLIPQNTTFTNTTQINSYQKQP